MLLGTWRFACLPQLRFTVAGSRSFPWASVSRWYGPSPFVVFLSPSRRLLFIHVPKTGGMSMRGALKKACGDLEDVPQYRHVPLEKVLADRPHYTDYFIAGFVRNPWDRLVSWWAMIDAAEARPDDHPHKEFLNRPLWQYVAQFDDFESFVRDIRNAPERFRRPQLVYLTTGSREADFIGRTEEMQRDQARLFERIGAPPVPLPHWNKSPRPASYREFYTDETAAIVDEQFRIDIEAFGYRF
jgi:Sulfotransferase family